MLWGIRFRDELSRPDELVNLIRRLHFEPWSMYRAKVDLGGEEWLGWGHEARILADTYDAIAFNTRATATQKAKPPKDDERYPRPAAAKRAKRRVRLDDDNHMNRLPGG